ncbi:hypothetical protein [Jannaschia ovalis]|uniref:SPW repeat-containing protein n=1 Tax=Jannaschia ovalis TaxID=3038773 RepID=A0ABY8LGF0_9RHOB|nr:hypothetical protein [Jannaschia sp. GRR-S6-38]WGH79473.1 hypothetical protein P8627_04180 [Jannaschia sp. GRR-S6-38]
MDVLELTRWAAAVATIAAALMVAWGEPPRLVAWGFALFVVASLCWIGASLAQDKPALLIQNGVLLAVNVWGLWRWWGRG